jgi:hypothetical protein
MTASLAGAKAMYHFPVATIISAFRMGDAREYLERAYTHFFAGDYDRAEFNCRLAMYCATADQSVKDAVATLAQILGVSMCENAAPTPGIALSD